MATTIPKRKKVSSKGNPNTETPSISNLNHSAPGEEKDMSFKVSDQFHKNFKIEAALVGMTMKDFLYKIFAEYKNNPK